MPSGEALGLGPIDGPQDRARLLRILGSLVTGREDSKLEAFGQELKRRLKVSLGLRRARWAGQAPNQAG